MLPFNYYYYSTKMVKRLIPILEQADHKQIHLFLDNDKSGKDTEQILKKLYAETGKFLSHHFYKDFKDVNEWWVAQKKKA